MEKKLKFIDAIIKDELKDVTFINDISSGTNCFTLLSKHSLTKVSYSIMGFMTKVSDICKSETGESLTWEKGDIKFLSSNMKPIDRIVTDFSRPRGAFEEEGLRTFNHWNPSKNMKIVQEMNKGKTKLPYDQAFDWFKYSNIKFLIENLLNEEENVSYSKTNKKDPVDIMHYFLNWLGHCIQYNEKTSNSVVFISPMHGTGKNVFVECVLMKYFGKEYMTEANNDTFLGTHNGIIDGKLFVYFNEAKVAFNDYEKVSNKMKSLISDSENIIRRMHQEQNGKSQFFNTLISSNYLIPFKVEFNDRRYTFFKNKNRSLEDLVSEKLGMHVSTFVEYVKAEAIDFLADLHNLKVDKKFAQYNALMNEAKKHVIKNTNTQVNNLMTLINDKEIELLKEYFFDCENDHMLPEFLVQVRLGFLTNEIVNNFLHINMREFDNNNKAAGKMNKKMFWDKQFGEAKAIPYVNSLGKTTSTKIRTFTNFDPKCLSDFFKKLGEGYYTKEIVDLEEIVKDLDSDEEWI